MIYTVGATGVPQIDENVIMAMQHQPHESAMNRATVDPHPAEADTATHHQHESDPDLALLQELLLQAQQLLDTEQSIETPQQLTIIKSDRRGRRPMREFLLAPEYQRIDELEARIADLQRQLHDRDALIQMLSPAISRAIAQQVQEAHDEMAEALYPVIGRTIQRAVTESMRDLARRIDHMMRCSMRMFFLWRLVLWIRGIRPSDAALREALPFQVNELFLIHRESGLLIQHLSASATLTDADLIASMLAAIRAYVQESFLPHSDHSLDSIEYGDMQILVEEGPAALLAVVVQGVQPAGFRAILRQQLTELHAAYGAILRSFQGDPIDGAWMLPLLQPLMEWHDGSA